VKSLRLLIELAKHVDVPSYERLMEASFGRTGFIFISINMLIFAYGAMVGYLIVIKSTLPNLLGVAPDNAQMKRAILTIASLSVILPISLQRVSLDQPLDIYMHGMTSTLPFHIYFNIYIFEVNSIEH